ncbi:unnamed protein product, partial [Hapterophycus canaliculatus]
MVIDESLISEESVASAQRIEEALAIWQFGWREDSRWLRASTTATNAITPPTASNGNRRPNGPEPAKSTAISTNALVHLRQVHHEGATVLIFLNEAPWAARVTLPLANLVHWNTAAGADIPLDSDSTIKWSSLSMTRPSVSMLGSTLTVPADGIVVCQTDQELSRDLTFGYRIEGGGAAIEKLTEDVTKIVEHLGLLGELACLTSSTADAIGKSDINAPANRVSNAWIHAVSDRQSNIGSNKSESGGWAASIWSSDRWGFSR